MSSSKLLVQSRSFLPMVIKKSTLETLHIVETQPTVSTKLVLPSKNDAPEKETLTEREHPKKGEIKILSIQDNLGNSKAKDCEVKVFPGRSLFQALLMDVMQVQGWLTKLLARGHMWMFRKEQGMLLRGSAQGPTSNPTIVFLEGQTRVKEEEPISILPEHSKTKPMKQKHSENYAVKKEEVKSKKKSDITTPFKSNFFDTVIQRAPEWQKSISANLGALQKKVGEKLPK